MARLGWIGPAIFVIGVATAGVGVWYWRHAMPKAGGELDRIDCEGATFVIRAEQGSDRSFLELHEGDELKWQALIPHYVGSPGRPALACSKQIVTVRIARGGRAEVFALAIGNGEKIGGYRMATDREPITTEASGPISLTDHVRSYEIVGGTGWHQLYAVDLATGEGAWKVDLGPEPVTGGAVEGKLVRIDQGNVSRFFRTADGLPNIPDSQ